MSNTTNFITPPDFVDEPNHTILLIDVDPVDVETLAFLCGSHNESFNVYLYKEDLNNLPWLEEAVDKADAIIINTVTNGISGIKEFYATSKIAYHYGPRDLGNERKHQTVLDYFVNRANELKSVTDTISSL
jgi:hypothetical protein